MQKEYTFQSRFVSFVSGFLFRSNNKICISFQHSYVFPLAVFKPETKSLNYVSICVVLILLFYILRVNFYISDFDEYV